MVDILIRFLDSAYAASSRPMPGDTPARCDWPLLQGQPPRGDIWDADDYARPRLSKAVTRVRPPTRDILSLFFARRMMYYAMPLGFCRRYATIRNGAFLSDECPRPSDDAFRQKWFLFIYSIFRRRDFAFDCRSERI